MGRVNLKPEYTKKSSDLKPGVACHHLKLLTGSDAGMEKLDAICMQLIAIGEGLNNPDKVTDNLLLPQYPQVEWKKAKALRDITLI